MPDPAAFDSLPLSPALLAVVAERGYAALTPVQAQAIPLLLAGRDLVGQSRTGSGKTAAFVLPLLARIALGERRVQALVLCPTRELCAQVAREVRALGRRHPGLRVAILSGGQPLYPQLAALERGAHVAVGTPGRVLDHLQRGSLDLRAARYAVLDEADRMLEMGFLADTESILRALPEERQTVLFSATFPRSIEAMSRAYQRDPARVVIEDDAGEPAIEQRAYEVEPADKPAALLALLREVQPRSALVFCNLKATVNALARELRAAGVGAAGLQGDLDQPERDRIMATFRNGSVPVLVATDVAARGLDITGLDAVLCFDLPVQPAVYVHRIGRTGRAGQPGLALALATPRERGRLQQIEEWTGRPIARLPLPSPEARAGAAILAEAAMETIYIAGGRKDKVRPGDILGALTGEAGGLAAEDVGRIEIHDHFSYVAVSKDKIEAVMRALRSGRIKGRRFRVERVRS